ncbi:site-specific DNA-methyltransferase [Acetoanaerobium noterae]|uniref:site-specific DNA-methyltransferase n=1 Tax=Acetoanaerobium noterae TaxID=745369 RepID=UPI0033295E27
MDKLKMHTPNLADDKFASLVAMFPNAITETIDENGEVVRTIDAEVLSQEINTRVIAGKEERYQFTWPDKKKSVLLANAPIAATLRPCKEESVDFDTTENLYIEGDNLDVLKLLRETYLNRVKMIYIDPPYNTGNDFIYEDDFKEETGEFLKRDFQYDDQGNRLTSNFDSNGRFHTDWLNMIYPRLRIARDLLTDDGVIFISIDDNELSNLIKLCDEVFGENNFIDIFSWKKTETPANLSKLTKKAIEYIVAYKKSNNISKLVGLKKESKSSNGLMNQTNSAHELIFPANTVDTGINDGIIKNGKYGTSSYEIHLLEDTEVKDGYFVKPVKLHGKFKWSQDNLNKEISNGTKISIRTAALSPSYERQEYEAEKPWNIIDRTFGVGTNENASKELDELIGINVFDFPKPTSLLKYLINSCTNETDIIVDFFSGSATTANAVMQLNAEDGGNRKFIMIQIPETCEEKSEAYKAGFKTICEIGKERIRRVREKIKEENKDKEGIENLDTGFRVLKLDSSNMKEVYYTPEDYAQMGFNLEGFMDNIKSDRSDEDLLFQVMLDLGIPLSATIRQEEKVFYVNDNYLIACFDKVDTDTITEMAKKKPYYVVFRDSSFINDSALVNVEQVFKTYSPSTLRRVL